MRPDDERRSRNRLAEAYRESKHLRRNLLIPLRENREHPASEAGWIFRTHSLLIGRPAGPFQSAESNCLKRGFRRKRSLHFADRTELTKLFYLPIQAIVMAIPTNAIRLA